MSTREIQKDTKAVGLETNATGRLEEREPAGISIIDLTKTYGKKAVVDQIDLTVRPGEFMTFLGPSGSGKTTTLSMIAGFTEVTSGELRIHGESVSRVPAHKRDIGMVFQNYALFPHLSVRANVEFPLRVRKIAKAKRAVMVEDALAMVRMTEYGDRFPGELSGGQQQRVALARALVYSPSVLLMDEPLGALDKKLRDWLQAEIKRIHTEVGSTFVYVTHDQEEALSMSDRIAVFNNGKIEQVGTGVELYERPATLFVGTFLGESTVLYGDSARSADGGAAGTVVRFAGHELRTTQVLDDTKVALLVRPEKLSLSRTGDETYGTNRNSLPVTVSTVTYLGSAWRIVVELPDGSSALVRTESNAGVPSAGEQGVLHWNVSDGVLLRDDR
ncbi:ABC transporter ATP-binding protein [Pseudoclavibacter sp. JSM 162008]|uniref:ABC transporter ATP-binding protein n=1 Tax=Pseudoclavibacter sp. JSM 162008 TaxID=3229855 RepID=UPI003526B048